MTEAATDSIVTREDGVLAGPIRHSVNTSAAAKGSIHDDATATRLGLRGGTVAGSIHMDLFPPLFAQAFGERWFERGSLSLYFINATVDREPVRAFLGPVAASASDVQVDAWIEREDGMRVAEGTASVGDPPELSALRARSLERFEAGELRILANVKPGDPIEETPVRYPAEQQANRLGVVTERMDVYEDPSRFGGRVVTPEGMVNLLYAQPVATLRKKIGSAVGLFGAIEIRNVKGPALVDTPYRVRGNIVAVGQSPKTEYFWFDTEMDDLEGRRVAEMRMLLRFMKASSELYREG